MKYSQSVAILGFLSATALSAAIPAPPSGPLANGLAIYRIPINATELNTTALNTTALNATTLNTTALNATASATGQPGVFLPPVRRQAEEAGTASVEPTPGAATSTLVGADTTASIESTSAAATSAAVDADATASLATVTTASLAADPTEDATEGDAIE